MLSPTLLSSENRTLLSPLKKSLLDSLLSTKRPCRLDLMVVHLKLLVVDIINTLQMRKSRV
jgi:hypothetical protein